MPVFKYIVGNAQGKKLSGTVEAPDENTARSELNNLGFSILLLQLTDEAPKIDQSLGKYIFEAIDKNSKLISGSIPAKNIEDALSKLSSEYNLTVSSIWPENSTEEQIKEAKKAGEERLKHSLSQPPINQATQSTEEPKEKSLEDEKQEAIVKAKTESILNQVNILLKNFDSEFEPDQKNEIKKKIDKILRIKNSTNFSYILASAEELLEYLQKLEETLKEKGHFEKRLELELSTKKMLGELHKSDKPESLSEDIMGKITRWESSHTNTNSAPAKIINSFLAKIKKFFTTPPEIIAIKEQIKVYNQQIWEFIKLYFKEPTPQYKEKVKNSIKTIWQARKKAKENLGKLKQELKIKTEKPKIEENLFMTFIEELNGFTGWLLAFYVTYYITGLYLSTKDFGLSKIPKGFFIYDTRIFKYILIIVFLLHVGTALKVNFFKKSIVASAIILPTFILLSIITLLNF